MIEWTLLRFIGILGMMLAAGLFIIACCANRGR